MYWWETLESEEGHKIDGSHTNPGITYVKSSWLISKMTEYQQDDRVLTRWYSINKMTEYQQDDRVVTKGRTTTGWLSSEHWNHQDGVITVERWWIEENYAA